MKLIKILEVIIDFLVKLPQRTTTAIHSYKEQIISAKGDKSKIELAKSMLFAFFLENWLFKVVTPLIIVSILGVLVTQYFISIGGALFVAYLIKSELAERKQKRIAEQRHRNDVIYRNVTKFIFNSLREMNTWVDVKQPQAQEDIQCPPYCDTQNEIDRFYFRLLKKSPEPIEGNKLAFSEKMLQSLINARLKEKEIAENRQLYYKDEPCLFVDNITDLGEFIHIQLVHVINEAGYDYVKRKKVGRPSSPNKQQPFDEDF
ncbi:MULTISPECIES: hypothetical protein [Lysinibacillus]|uniref:hypothetical protein n=1 Tax=Lysinibacillus TaxID=400634 RepID=UPI00214BECAF|nr:MULTISPECIES: hypothetical protein [Lysinibacillus]UUV24342.1 hypothetical protein NP781_21565 [Lysinibacillus sp. FN11]UYB47215.1 hypothetical protein OCI51_24180 [Lysinibacillus capsici]